MPSSNGLAKTPSLSAPMERKLRQKAEKAFDLDLDVAREQGSVGMVPKFIVPALKLNNASLDVRPNQERGTEEPAVRESPSRVPNGQAIMVEHPRRTVCRVAQV